MNKKNNISNNISLLFLLSDILFLEIAFVVAYCIRFYSPMVDILHTVVNYPPIMPYLLASFIIIPIWAMFFNSKGLYEQGRYSSILELFSPIVKSTTLCMFVVLSVAFFYRDFSYSRAVFVNLYFISIFFVLLGRELVFYYERKIRDKGLLQKNIIIIGLSEQSKKVYDSLKNENSLLYDIVGYCAENDIGDRNYVYLGNISQINSIILKKNISSIIAISDKTSNIDLLEIMKACEGYNIEFMYLPEALNLITNKMYLKTIGETHFIRLKQIPISGLDNFLKRSFDITFSLLFLICTAPISLVIIILIKLESKGPLFYFQERVGLEGEIFKTIKFRSMKIDAETASGPIWAKSDDNRTTKIGKFVRKYSIDEIPQFFNVLKGEMSVVGPRPERPFFVNKFKDIIPGYLERHRMKTGITGWAQVNGLRGNTSLDERIKYDNYYIENWSLLFDIMIIFKTLKEVFFSKNAY
jgi:exopolysaccharide biosynthesis polyprenyl glycosylphosphotransferase